jgi:hypothetical protein
MTEVAVTIAWTVGLILIFIVVPVVAIRALPDLSARAVLWFRCPLRDRDVRVEFEEEPWDGRHRDVLRCSEFPDSAITCDKACLRLEPLPSARDLIVRAE